MGGVHDGTCWVVVGDLDRLRDVWLVVSPWGKRLLYELASPGQPVLVVSALLDPVDVLVRELRGMQDVEWRSDGVSSMEGCGQQLIGMRARLESDDDGPRLRATVPACSPG